MQRGGELPGLEVYIAPPDEAQHVKPGEGGGLGAGLVGVGGAHSLASLAYLQKPHVCNRQAKYATQLLIVSETAASRSFLRGGAVMRAYRVAEWGLLQQEGREAEIAYGNTSFQI